jgi:hypothetical protein
MNIKPLLIFKSLLIVTSTYLLIGCVSTPLPKNDPTAAAPLDGSRFEEYENPTGENMSHGVPNAH